jgi:hypothetical protein
MTKSRFNQKNDRKGQDNYVSVDYCMLPIFYPSELRGPSSLEPITGFLDWMEAP